jgi:hypothetical protein
MNQSAQIGYSEERVMNSNLPPAIKKAMLEKPIPQLTSPSYTFSLDDVADLQEEKKMGLPKAPKTKPLTESYNNNSEMISVTKEQLREMVNDLVNEKLLEFFIKNNNKTIAENAVKKTITTLMNEGKIIAKKK